MYYSRKDPSIGIYGMDFYMVLGRVGENVGKARRVGSPHSLHREDAMKFQTKYDRVILGSAKKWEICEMIMSLKIPCPKIALP